MLALDFTWWWLGLVVARWSRSMNLPYAGTGQYWDGRPSAGRYITSVCDQPLRPTQPSTLSGMENEYQPKCSDAQRGGGEISQNVTAL